LVVLRPADGNETAAAWKAALERTTGPTALLLSRQGLPVFGGTGERSPEGVARGAYTLTEAPGGVPDIILIATGGEVSLVVEAMAELESHGVRARVVSMPSWELFAGQSDDYRRQVLPDSIPRLAVEAGVTLGWRDVVGDTGAVIGIDRYGASAPGAEVAQRLGLNVKDVVAKAVELVEEST
jgi:transketolase